MLTHIIGVTITLATMAVIYAATIKLILILGV